MLNGDILYGSGHRVATALKEKWDRLIADRLVTVGCYSYHARMNDVPVLPSVIFGGAAGAISVAGLWAYSVFVPRCQFWAPVIRSLPQREGVALTFDNGPDAEITPRVLDALAAQQVKATFFVIGRRAREQAAMLKRIHSEGHAIGNHSFDHDPAGWKRGRLYWERQLSDTQATVVDITGQPPLLFRPPWGRKTRHIGAVAQGLRLPIIGWSVTAGPGLADAGAYAERLMKRVSGHDILLLQDGPEPGNGRANGSIETALAALPAMIESIREKKLQVVPLIDALVAAGEEIQSRPRTGSTGS